MPLPLNLLNIRIVCLKKPWTTQYLSILHNHQGSPMDDRHQEPLTAKSNLPLEMHWGEHPKAPLFNMQLMEGRERELLRYTTIGKRKWQVDQRFLGKIPYCLIAGTPSVKSVACNVSIDYRYSPLMNLEQGPNNRLEVRRSMFIYFS